MNENTPRQARDPGAAAPQAHAARSIRTFVFVSMTLSGLATTVILPILAPLIQALHLSPSQGGWMLSIGSLVMAATATAWGNACDRWGRRPVMLAGFLGLFVSYALYTAVVWLGLQGALAGTALFVLLTAMRAMVGGFLPAVPSAAQALMADHTAVRDRSSGMAVIGAATGLGLVLGPALSGLLALQGLIWPLVLSSVLCLAAAVMTRMRMPPAPPRAAGPAVRLNPFDAVLRPWLLAGVLTMSAVITAQISCAFYFQQRLGLSNAQAASRLAIAFTLVGVALFATQVLQIRLLRWRAHRMVVTGAACWIAALLVMRFAASTPEFLLAYAVMGVGAGFLIPGYTAGASLALPPAQQGAAAGLSAATQGVAFIVAPVTGTLLYELDPTLPLWGLMALMALLIAGFLWRGEDHRGAVSSGA